MNTMPNIKLGEIFPLTPIDETRRCASIDMEPLHQNASAAGGDKGRETNLIRGGAGNSCLQSLAQSCTSIVVGFHSNTIISPVIEVEELEENDEVFNEKDSEPTACLNTPNEPTTTSSEPPFYEELTWGGESGAAAGPRVTRIEALARESSTMSGYSTL